MQSLTQLQAEGKLNGQGNVNSVFLPLFSSYIWDCLLFFSLPHTFGIAFCFLPPASEGWGKVLFSVCLSVHISGGGYPSQVWGGPHPRSGQGGYPIPGLGWGGTPSQVWTGGTPQTWDRVPPDLGQGTLRTWDGVPPPTWNIASTWHLLRGGRYASCVHAGGLSCSPFVLIIHLGLPSLMVFSWHEILDYDRNLTVLFN